MPRTLTHTTLALMLAGLGAFAFTAPALAQAKPGPAKPASAATAAKPEAKTEAAPQLLAAQSELRFTSRQMGVPVDGSFKRFEAKLAFDPKKPEAGNVAFNIDLASVTLGDPMLDAELAKPAWFDSKKAAQASFQSSAIKALGGGRYEVAGKLTIKGQQRDIVVPLALAQANGVSTATGGFVLKRLEFKIGDGEWSDTSMVANDVQVKFKLAFSGVAAL
ncbi:YceI family protein [Paucibacter sp. APW11]|uniref:YceI family protein n=1 Tax=Roseateles aquae TaxID=3077235 RepID=A0ABU3PDR1_9BURK|nr:YceI family protein [Paucibacter sp. APW11]MDT9000016.1 YceI family protein [Paucibacter sp. APW11]